MTRIALPEGHVWKEVYVDSGVGVEYQWECRCGAMFYVCIDQDDITTQYEDGDGHELHPFVVLCRTESELPGDPPLAFDCMAESTEHAEEQCLDAYPGAEIMWVHFGDAPDKAYEEYWGTDASAD